MFSVRLACVKRAASVRPEPGSNSLFKLYIQTLRVFISILAITIRSQLPLWFFCLFWLLKVPISWNLKGFFACSALFNFQDTFEAAFVLQLLYHIQKFLSSKHFVNWSSTCFLFIPSRRDQLFYFITFCRFCQVNILWTEVHSIFSFPFPRQPVQNSQPIHSTTLQTFCQVNFSWTTPTANCRSPDPFHSSRYSQVSSTFALVRQLYYYTMRFRICQVNICKRILQKTMQIAQATVLPSYKTMYNTII